MQARRVSARLRAIAGGLQKPEARRALRRQYTFESLRAFVPVIGVETDDGLIFVSTQDQTVGRSVYVSGQWDRDGLSNALSVAAKHGFADLTDTAFVEVGANIGTTTLQAARLFPRCVVVEPGPKNLALLNANLAANGVRHRVNIVAAGASDTTGTARFALSQKNHGDHRIRDDGDTTISLMRLDDILSEHAVERVGLLWLDTQGHEARVLAGAPELLQSPPVTVTEFWPPVLGEDMHTFVHLVGAWSTIIDLSRPADGPVSISDVSMRYAEAQTDLLLLP